VLTLGRFGRQCNNIALLSVFREDPIVGAKRWPSKASARSGFLALAEQEMARETDRRSGREGTNDLQSPCATSPRVIEDNEATPVTSGPTGVTYENTLISADPVVCYAPTGGEGRGLYR
jgi:hypothetical protein